jgi:hypothetical protein
MANEKYQRSRDSVYKDWHLLWAALNEQQNHLRIHRRTHLWEVEGRARGAVEIGN